MGNISIPEVLVTPLDRKSAEGGAVYHAMKSHDRGYAGFGEAYFSWILPKYRKGWKLHMHMTMNLIVPIGKVKFVFYSEKYDCFREEIIGEDIYQRITVPPNIWFAFTGLAEPSNLVLNLASIPHDPEEVIKRSMNSINYNWVEN